MDRKWVILLVVVLVIVTCSFSGCAKAASKLAVLKAGVKVNNALDSASTYTDSDTIQENQMCAYELLGEKGTVYNIHYEGNGPVDLMILDPENYYRYDRALDGSNSGGGIRGQLYLNKNEVGIKFTQPDDQQYRFIIDNTYLMTNGANSGRSVAYTLTVS